MLHHKLFPTNIFLIDNLLSNEELSEMHKRVTFEKEDTENWQSDYLLHHDVYFKNFAELVIIQNKKALKTLGYHFQNLEITDMWANVLRPGEMHTVHNHSNNFFSGVFYVYAHETSGINFSDPRPQASVFLPKKEDNLDNANVITYDSKSNRMLLFPSWLSHWVPINKSKHDRISISWNIMIRGEMGEHKDFQSANF